VTAQERLARLEALSNALKGDDDAAEEGQAQGTFTMFGTLHKNTYRLFIIEPSEHTQPTLVLIGRQYEAIPSEEQAAIPFDGRS
jgi:hypothetical protein